MGGPPIRIVGLAELSRELKKLDAELPKELRRGLKAIADKFVGGLSLPGSLRAQARSTQRSASVRLPDVQSGFIEFGNVVRAGAGVGRGDSHPRRYIATGRFIFPAAERQRDRIESQIEDLIGDLIRKAGLDEDRT